MTRNSLPVDPAFPVPDAPLTLPQVFGAIFVTLGTAGAIFFAGLLLIFPI